MMERQFPVPSRGFSGTRAGDDEPLIRSSSPSRRAAYSGLGSTRRVPRSPDTCRNSTSATLSSMNLAGLLRRRGQSVQLGQREQELKRLASVRDVEDLRVLHRAELLRQDERQHHAASGGHREKRPSAIAGQSRSPTPARRADCIRCRREARSAKDARVRTWCSE